MLGLALRSPHSHGLLRFAENSQFNHCVKNFDKLAAFSKLSAQDVIKIVGLHAACLRS